MIENLSQQKGKPPHRTPYYDKGGRPHKADKEKHRHVVSVRFSDEEFAQIRAYAKGCKMPLSAYVRDMVMDRRPRAALSEDERTIVAHWGEILKHLTNMDNYFKHSTSWNLCRFEMEQMIGIIKDMLGITSHGGRQRKEEK